jgi:hypothetical protein
MENCLRMAVAHGRKPEGTLAPHRYIYSADGSLHEERSILDEQWNGNYYSKDGQIVTDSDARSLAAALNRAVASMRKAGLDNEEDSLILVLLADRARRGGFAIW